MSFRLTMSCLAAVAGALIVTQPARAEDYRYSVGLGVEFSSGKYGGSLRTNSVYAPLTIIATPTERFGLSLEIPFVYQSRSNVLSSVDHGTMLGGKSTMMTTAGMGGMAGSGMTGSGMSSSGTGHAEAGLGDITLKAGYLLVLERSAIPQVRPLVFVKFPTADSSRALGTGEYDAGGSVEVSKWLGNWNPFAEAGYTWQGKSERLALKDYLAYNAGVGYQIGDSLRPILLVKGATAPAVGSSGLLELRLKLKYQATDRIGFEGYAAHGLTTNSPDYGTGLSVFYSF